MRLIYYILGGAAGVVIVIAILVFGFLILSQI